MIQESDGMVHSLLWVVTGKTKYYFNLLIHLCHRNIAVTTTPRVSTVPRHLLAGMRTNSEDDKSKRVALISHKRFTDLTSRNISSYQNW